MKCPEIDVLQAYIDCELDIAARKEVENHLASCPECSSTYAGLKENDDFAFSKISSYKQYCSENFNPPAPLSKHTRLRRNAGSFMKEVKQIMFNYRKTIIAAGIVAALTLSITVQPVRSALSDALSIFRVENVKGIQISLTDLQNIKTQLDQKASEINMDKLGKIKTSGGEQRQLSYEDAKSITDIKVLFPSSLQDQKPLVSSMDPFTMEMTLNISNVNETLKSFGAKKLLPASVDGKTFNVDFSRQVALSYRLGDRYFEIVETRSPQIIVPSGVDVDEIYSSLTELPILPDNLQKQLKSIKDWKNTIYFPVIDSKSDMIDIGGNTAYVYSEAGNQNKNPGSWVMWYKDNTIYVVHSNGTRDEVIEVAKSMKGN